MHRQWLLYTSLLLCAMAVTSVAKKYCIVANDVKTANQVDAAKLSECSDEFDKCKECFMTTMHPDLLSYSSKCAKSSDSGGCHEILLEPCTSPVMSDADKCYPELMKTKSKTKCKRVSPDSSPGDAIYCGGKCGAGAGFGSDGKFHKYAGCYQLCEDEIAGKKTTRGGSVQATCKICSQPSTCGDDLQAPGTQAPGAASNTKASLVSPVFLAVAIWLFLL